MDPSGLDGMDPPPGVGGPDDFPAGPGLEDDDMFPAGPGFDTDRSETGGIQLTITGRAGEKTDALGT
jgi:hypothetical protein